MFNLLNRSGHCSSVVRVLNIMRSVHVIFPTFVLSNEAYISELTSLKMNDEYH